MSKLIKNMVTDELKSRYGDVDSALWVEFVNVDGHTNNDFRRALYEREMRIEIVKNSMFRRAVMDGPLKVLGDALTGPSAVVTGGESVIDVAKVIAEWSGKIKGLRMRGAVLEGEYIDEQSVGDLPKMPTKVEMQGRVVACVRAPGANLAAAMLSGGGNIAGCLKAIIEKLENGEAVAA